MALTDVEILQLLRTDYRAAFKLLYKDYYRMVEYLVTRNSGSTADAEDIFQEVMLVIFDKSRQPDFELSCAVKTFIYSVGRNLWFKKLRTINRTSNITDFEAFENIAVEDEPADDDGKLQKVTAAMQAMGESCRKILMLFYYQKKNMVEIAAELGYSNAENAKNQKYKCLQQLKSKVANA